MDATTLLNTAAVLTSLLALGVSSRLVLRQAKLQDKANHLPAFMYFLAEIRSAETHERYNYVCTQLAREHSADLGISGLPEQSRTAIYDIAYFYVMVATLARTGILKDDELLALIGRRVVLVWDAIAPFVAREQELNPAAGSMSVLADFAERARNLPPGRATERLRRIGSG
jgi:hypothetical protein